MHLPVDSSQLRDRRSATAVAVELVTEIEKDGDALQRFVDPGARIGRAAVRGERAERRGGAVLAPKLAPAPDQQPRSQGDAEDLPPHHPAVILNGLGQGDLLLGGEYLELTDLAEVRPEHPEAAVRDDPLGPCFVFGGNGASQLRFGRIIIHSRRSG